MSDPGAIETRLVRAYVTTMMAFMGRALEAIGPACEIARGEIAELPEGFVFEMRVWPSGPSARVAKRGDRFEAAAPHEAATVSISIKHLRHAYTLLAFRESTPTALASERLVIDGDVAQAMRIQRILARVQALLLPDAVAERALGDRPAHRLREKLPASARLYGRLAWQALSGAFR